MWWSGKGAAVTRHCCCERGAKQSETVHGDMEESVAAGPPELCALCGVPWAAMGQFTPHGRSAWRRWRDGGKWQMTDMAARVTVSLAAVVVAASARGHDTLTKMTAAGRLLLAAALLSHSTSPLHTTIHITMPDLLRRCGCVRLSFFHLVRHSVSVWPSCYLPFRHRHPNTTASPRCQPPHSHNSPQSPSMKQHSANRLFLLSYPTPGLSVFCLASLVLHPISMPLPHAARLPLMPVRRS